MFAWMQNKWVNFNNDNSFDGDDNDVGEDFLTVPFQHFCELGWYFGRDPKADIQHCFLKQKIKFT